MATARADVLARIRSALGDRGPSRAADLGRIARSYRQQGHLDARRRLELFASRIEDYDGVVYWSSADTLSRTIAQALTSRGKRRIVVPLEIRIDLPDGFEFVPDRDPGYADLDRSDGALTECTVAIALTGTIALRHGAAEGRRALTLVPDYHMCIVREDQVVETVPEAIRRLASIAPRVVTTISGPSATADIEMTRIKGVHGPRTLDVILVSGFVPGPSESST